VYHLIAPLDPDHVRAVDLVTADLAGELDLAPGTLAPFSPHVTIASYTGLDPAHATHALVPAAATIRPFHVRAHGYGVFTGDADADLSLHVIVVRTRELDDLHRRTHAALCRAGACVAGTTDPGVWTPHVTLFDRGLTPALLGRAVELLARRPHRSWTIPVTALAVVSREGGTAVPPALPLGTRSWAGRPNHSRAERPWRA
jgi:2'-5' RNA ligase